MLYLSPEPIGINLEVTQEVPSGLRIPFCSVILLWLMK